MKTEIKIPNPTYGFIFSLLLAVSEYFVFPNADKNPLSSLIALIAFCYYVMNVYLIHSFILQKFNNKYPYTPEWAMVANIIPIYNVYWMYKWVYNISLYYSSKLDRQIFNRPLVHCLMFGGIILNLLDFTLGHIIFWSGIYIVIQKITRLHTSIVDITNLGNKNFESLSSGSPISLNISDDKRKH